MLIPKYYVRKRKSLKRYAPFLFLAFFKAYLCPKVIHFDAVDFSDGHLKKSMFLLTLRVILILKYYVWKREKIIKTLCSFSFFLEFFKAYLCPKLIDIDDI